MEKRFGDCVLDSEPRQLLRAGRPVHLSPKAYGLLELLLERAPRALSKREILDVLWPRTFVAESSLTNIVSELRRRRRPGPKTGAPADGPWFRLRVLRESRGQS